MPCFESGPIQLRGMRFDLLSCQWDSFGITVRVSVPDRDTDAPVEISFRAHWPEVPRSTEHLAEMLEAGLAWMVAHEMAERMLVYGRRRDPHARADHGPPPRMQRLSEVLDPLDEVSILTRAELLQYIVEYRSKLGLTGVPDVFETMADVELRGLVRSLHKAASTTP